MRRPLLLLTALLLFAGPAHAQQPWAPDRLTAEDYARAERFLSGAVGGLVTRDAVRPVWVDGERFWYRNTLAVGAEFVLVDAARGTREPAFDHTRLAGALTGVLGRTVESAELPFRAFE
ncbi:MAG: S9 family peptidase, partial [Gemmatimonadota bacterium]